MSSLSLLDILDRGGFEASLITTFNAYLPFYENVVLHRLKTHGINHNIVLMDTGCFAESMQSDQPALAGQEYSLVPMHSKSKGVFHPKMILLVGRSRGALVVGSHNLTLSGFGFNKELTNVVMTEGTDDLAAQAIIKQAWQSALHWLEQQPGHGGYWRELLEKFSDFAPWLEKPVEEEPSYCKVIATASNNEALFDQLLESVSSPVSRVLITGAFFDSEMSFIREVKRRLNPDSIHVGIDPETVQLPGYQALDGVEFHDASHLTDGKGYLHAKAIVLEMEDGQCIFASGSANPSSPAWLAHSNTEMMLVLSGDQANFVANDLSLLGIPDLPVLSEAQWEKVSDNWVANSESELKDGSIFGICFLEQGKINVKGYKPAHISECQLICSRENRVPCSWQQEGDVLWINFPDHLPGMPRLLVIQTANTTDQFLVHQIEHINHRSETGQRRALRQALNSLSSEQPEIETFLNLIQPLLTLEKPIEVTNPRQGHQVYRSSDSDAELEEGKSLSASVEEWRQSKGSTLSESDDLVLVLNGLSHMIWNPDSRVRSIEHLDQLGRSEEEQIGEDDDDSQLDITLPDKVIVREQPERIRRCVHSLLYRVKQILEETCFSEKNTYRLAAQVCVVLAVLRQLRILENDRNASLLKREHVEYIPNGEFSILLQQLMGYIFDGDIASLAKQKDNEFAGSQQFSSLIGLTVWVAWESGMEFQDKKPFNESSAELKERYRNNAALLRLAEFAFDDQVALEEARNTFSKLCEGEQVWLKKFEGLVYLTGEALAGRQTKIEHPIQGCLAWKEDMPELGLRMVESFNGQILSLTSFQERKAVLRFGNGDYFHFYSI